MEKEERNEMGLTEKEFLEQYNPDIYPKPSVTVDIMLLKPNPDTNGIQVLLIKRKNHPFINQWALPGGFMNIDESAYQAACRELEEETGITNVPLSQLCAQTKPDRDPRMRIVDIAYLAYIPDSQIKEQAGDDAEDAKWFDVHFTDESMILCNDELELALDYRLEKLKIPKIMDTFQQCNYIIPTLVSDDGLAFDHEKIIYKGLKSLQVQLIDGKLGFVFDPEE